MKQTAVEWYGGQIGLLFHLFHTNRITITEFHYQSLELEKNAKEMEKEQSQKYAEFAIECDRAGLPILDFEGFKNL